jgi:hypothetical protein
MPTTFGDLLLDKTLRIPGHSRSDGVAVRATRSNTARDGGRQPFRVRWLGPPRLRMAVPDSRNMLWTDPYDRPVDATSVRILAPPS